MKKNLGNIDKIIRVLIAGIIVALSYFEIIDGTLAIILLAIAFILTLTSFINFCPLYALIGKSTCEIKSN